MSDILRSTRSVVSFLFVGLLFVLGSLVLRLFVLPANWLFPGQRFRLVSVFMKGMSAGILGLLTLGGARFRRFGTVPTDSPVLIVSNHQSLLEILQVALLSRPRVPAFVTRTRYARFVPLVSASIRLLGCPLVDPRRDPRGAVDAIRQGVRTLPHGVLIFPEGHRSIDGEIRPFRNAGLEALLEERRMPVYLVVNDGMWRVAHFSDLLFRVYLVDATSRVIGPLEPPLSREEFPRFIQELRDRLAAALHESRQRLPAA